jgi:hypothetical protein
LTWVRDKPTVARKTETLVTSRHTASTTTIRMSVSPVSCSPMERVKKSRSQFVRARPDPTLSSERVLAVLLASEGKYLPAVEDYMRQVQRELLPQHRKIVTDWMLEVTEEQECSPQVFLSAVHYLDRVLACLPVTRAQLQLLSSACLLLASKLHDPRPLSLLNLVVYTDCSISVSELQSMEMLVLEKLRWELAAPTSVQVLSLMLARMEHLLSSQVLSIVQRHASTFLALAATEYTFHHVKPSLMVSATILTAIHGLCPTISSQTGFQNLLCSMTGTKMQDLVLLVRQLEVRVAGWIRVATQGTEDSVMCHVTRDKTVHDTYRKEVTSCHVTMDTS